MKIFVKGLNIALAIWFVYATASNVFNQNPLQGLIPLILLYAVNVMYSSIFYYADVRMLDNLFPYNINAILMWSFIGLGLSLMSGFAGYAVTYVIFQWLKMTDQWIPHVIMFILCLHVAYYDFRHLVYQMVVHEYDGIDIINHKYKKGNIVRSLLLRLKFLVRNIVYFIVFILTFGIINLWISDKVLNRLS